MTGMFRLLALALVALLGLTGCSTDGLSTSELQDEVQAVLERADSDGPAAVQLHCDGGLAAEVGAERDCTALAGEERVGLRVKATSADPLRLAVAPFLRAESLAKKIVAILSAEGHPVTGAECEGSLTGKPGKTTTCHLWTEDHSHTYDVEVTVTAVDGLMIEFKFEEIE